MSYTNPSSSPWTARISNAVKLRTKWENEFKCKTLEDYYEGKQWRNKGNQGQIINYNPYTINLFVPTIKIKLAAMTFQKPSFQISPSTGNSHWNQEVAISSAQLKQDVLNTVIKNPQVNFTKHLKLAAKESFFRFGLIEVGYAADWRNPQKEDPYLKSWEDKNVSEEKDRVLDDNEVPVNERFFVKRIQAKKFLVPESESTDLAEHDWCGYSQYYYTSTLKNTKGIKFPDTYISGTYSTDWVTTGIVGESEEKRNLWLTDGSVCRVYHIFDLIAKKRRLLLDDGQFTELWCSEMERLPLVDLRWDIRSSGFYPIPPCFHWLSPQDEINESREQARSHRRRFTTKYAVKKNAVDPEEQEKFFSGPDGIGVEVKEIDAIKAIDPPDVGNTNQNELILSKEDFNVISGSSAEARPGGDRETATKSQIADQRAKISESADQLEFSEYACLIGREILCQMQEKLTGGLWVKYSSGPGEGVMEDLQEKQQAYKYISAEDVSDGYDFTIDIDINNATPAAMEAQQNSFLKFLQVLTQFPMIAMSPILIREAAYRVGYKNEQVIHQMQQVAILSLAAKANQAANAKGTTLGAAAQSTQQQQMEIPGQAQISDQLTQQLQ